VTLKILVDTDIDIFVNCY